MVVGDVHLILVNRAGRVLFGQRQNTGYEDGAWHLPSGHLEAGESVVAALIREAFFTVHNWTGVPENREPDKSSGLSWFSLDGPVVCFSYLAAASLSVSEALAERAVAASQDRCLT
jgi:hypothetical protein